MTARQLPEQDDFAAEPQSIDLREYWLVIRRRWLLVVVVALLGTAAGAGYAVTKGPTYSATSQVVVTGVTQGPLAPATQASLQQVNMSTEQAIAQSASVIALAAGYLHVRPTVLEQAAAKRLAVTVPASTLTTSNVLQIVWKAATPREAQAGANAFARAYLSYRHNYLASAIATYAATLKSQSKSLQAQIAGLAGQISRVAAGSSAHQTLVINLNQLTGQASTVASELAAIPIYNDNGGSVLSASKPARPSSLSHSDLGALGLLLGVLVGVLLAFVRDAFDDRIRDALQLERRLGAETLAVLAQPEAGQAPAVATAASPDSRAADLVRGLRATLVAATTRRNLRTILVVAADPGISSGRIVAELGVALAEAGRRVLLVASDLRGSVLPQIFEIPNDVGLSDLLVGGGDPAVLIRQPRQASSTPLPAPIVKRLAVLPSGRQMTHTLSVLDSGSMIDLLEGQREAYEFLLLDAPPASVSDVFALAAHVDGVIVVARQGGTRGRGVEAVRRRLDQVGAVVIGGVMIGKGSAGRHRSEGSPRAASVAPMRAAPQAPGRDAAVRLPSPETRPMPAVTDDFPAPSGGTAARSS
jgi:Mrp family chromosome partitioning ATPase